MLRKLIVSLLATVVGLVAVPVLGQIHSSSPPWRVHGHSQHRPGALTYAEFRHLQHQQRQLRQQRGWYLRDGRLNARERQRLHALKMHQRRDVFRFRHNRFHQ